jgi:hypothetical protein
MNTLAKLIASIAALIASLALAWITKDGFVKVNVSMNHSGTMSLGGTMGSAIQVQHVY